MPTPLNEDVKVALKAAIRQPCLANVRCLEAALDKQGFGKRIFGRLNQKSSIEAASESDRGITERLANAFDASLKAALLSVGIDRSDRSLTPRNCAQRFLCPNAENADWSPQDDRISFSKPVIEFWPENEHEKNRFRKYNPGDGLASVLVRDFGVGIGREDMPRTIPNLNSESKLRSFEAIGQFGHGGSSSLAFCESCLIISKPRFKDTGDDFYWTLIVIEREEEESKQNLIRRWFCVSQPR
ncbi:MAG TPA: hypothetical protein VK138_07565 [Acidiferrobacterales bacterium]|nr:hypothetical protein [Acidiferrobacterales bacterium]